MNNRQRLFVSSGVASLIAPTVFAVFDAWSRGGFGAWVAVGFVVAWLVTVLHLLVLGLPLLLFLQCSGRLTWPAISVAGFAAGFIPVGIATMPLLSVGHVSLDDWRRYLAWCASFGVLGALTAIGLRAGYPTSSSASNAPAATGRENK